MQIDSIQIEFRVGLFLSAIAFVLSFATGFISGIALGTVIFRGVIFAVVFFAIGFGGLQVLKKLVPEVYEAVSNIQFSAPAPGDDVVESADLQAGDLLQSFEDGEPDSGFTELTEKDFERYNTQDDTNLESALNPSEGKMGKHIVVQQQFNAYEPKLMAQAIKTMMSKDKD
jgi:hypothetical protein